jgi:hypothetical protein
MCHYNLEVASAQRCVRQSSFVTLASIGTTFILAFSFGNTLESPKVLSSLVFNNIPLEAFYSHHVRQDYDNVCREQSTF